MNNPIGIFDSGVGGLTVLDYMRQQFPHENMIYIGDNAHCPYGDKTKSQLLEYTRQICDYFAKQHVKMIVLACNTTSANVLDELQKLYPHKYRQMLLQYNPELTVYELATPRLVPVIESGEYKYGIQELLGEYLLPYQNKIDALILGCTHYPILLKQFQDVMEDIDYISSSASICQEVASYLKNHHLENTSSLPQTITIYTTGDTQTFVESSQGFFDYQDLSVSHLHL